MRYIDWQSPISVKQKSYICSYCGNKVGPNMGYRQHSKSGAGFACIYICPSCSLPTFIDTEVGQIPAPRLGRDVDGITDSGVESLYNEARDSTSVGAYTAVVLLCRKILMNIAVHHGAKEGKTFKDYVDYLESERYVPPNGKDWVDIIRLKGNEATHEIALMEKEDAEQILNFVEMLLRFIYEFPAMIKKDDSVE